MNRSSFKRRLYVPAPVAPLTPVVGCTAVMSRPSPVVVAVPKMELLRSEAWLRAVSALDCVLCYRSGMTQAAHRNEGKGMAMKTHDCWTAALCTECHARIDSGKDLSREERRAMLDMAILLTLVQLAKNGMRP
jgi:hypothetical protein